MSKTARRRPAERSVHMHWVLMALAVIACLSLPKSPSLRADLAIFDAASSASDVSSGPIGVCSFSDLFPKEDEKNPPEKWNNVFTQTVQGVIAGDQDAKVQCENQARTAASGPLAALEKQLPQWKNLPREPLESDLTQVLLDYMESYGCALEADEPFITYEITHATDDTETCKQEQAQQSCDEHIGCLWIADACLAAGDDYNSLNIKAIQVKNRRNDELALARETLKRTLVVVQELNKLRPLDNAFTCFNRASKDLRNVMGLAAETSTCMPLRTWDVRGQLRTLPDGTTKP